MEPLPNFRVVRDVVVGMEGLLEKYGAVRPYLLPEGEAPEPERLHGPEDRRAIDEASRCILCACRTAAGPIIGENPDYLVTGALLRAFRSFFDTRDRAGEGRMEVLDSPDAIRGCKGHGTCAQVRPKESDGKKCLLETKKRLHDAGRSPRR